MAKMVPYLFVVMILFQANLVHAQKDGTFTLFVAGNTSLGKSDFALLNQWRRQSSSRQNFAVVLAGNVTNKKTGLISDELLLNKNHPVIIAPGKSEWGGGTSDGKDFIKNLAEALPKTYNNPVFLPEPACPGPNEVILNEHLVVILLDTWWWVHKYDRRFSKCGITHIGDVLVQLDDIIGRHYAAKHVVVAGYHALESYGNTSGHFSTFQWLIQFPTTFYRKLPGTRHDRQHPDFKDFRNGLLSVLEKYPNVVYVSAGEANLQYFEHGEIHFVNAGSWQNREYVSKKIPGFGVSENGFAQLTFSPEGISSLAFFNTSDTIFRKELYKKQFHYINPGGMQEGQLPDSTIAVASAKYNLSEPGHFWMGKNYRDVWAKPVMVPVFDLGTNKGGLEIVKRGGGQQTFSLRLKDKDGRQYVLRSIDKYVEGAVPQEFHKTFAVDLVQDQISASNPYAAKVVSELAEHAGIFHTNPVVVYVPDDPRFGIYRHDVAGQLFLFEERPESDSKGMTLFGGTENIISTERLLEKTTTSSNHFIDESAFLRARLFDILINDWDRHEDQWRWAGFEHDGRTAYLPIPRDRDQAFFLNEGVIPWIAARKWLLPKIQGFTEQTGNMEGQSFNARYLDRSLLVQSDWDDWQLQIDILRYLLTPESIDSAMLAFPKEVYPVCGPETARILKARLNNLGLMARNLYLSLAKEVYITGTDGNDIFDLVALSDTVLQISGYNLTKDRQKGWRFYQRTFYTSETRKIYLYGLQGNDRFEIAGNHQSTIEIYIAGGNNKVEIASDKDLMHKNILVYADNNTKISPEGIVRQKIRFDQNELAYDREHFKFDMIYPGVFSGYNPDDGIFLGGGPVITKYSRYRQHEYEILGNYALATNAVNLSFSTKQTFPLRRVDVSFGTRYNSPGYAGNFFGMGNETQRDFTHYAKEYYRLRLSQISTEIDFVKWLGQVKIHTAGPGLFYSFTDVEKTAGRFIASAQNGLTASDLSSHAYAGVYFKHELNTLRNTERKAEEDFAGSNTFPTRGIQIKSRAGYYAGLNSQSADFLKFTGDGSFYFSFSQRPRVVYAFRAGGEKLFGDFAFHEAATLGRTENLRGYRETRFYGDASFYLNAEVRVRMKQFQTYLLNGTAGVVLFNDTGRVWLKSENSNKWHNGTGFGFWVSPFDMAVFNISYAASQDDRLVNFMLNYQF